MAAHNDREFLPEAIESIFNQTFHDWELLISDDASSDGSFDWLQENVRDSRVKLFRNHENIGLVANKNRIISQARGSFVTQQDADDRSAPERLERQIASFLADPKLDIVSCGLTRIDECGRRIDQVVPASDIRLDPGMDPAFPFWFAPMMVRTELISVVGPLHDWFEGGFGEDHYWGLRASKIASSLCLAAPLYEYRYNPRSTTNSINGQKRILVAGVLKEVARQLNADEIDLLSQEDGSALAAFEAMLLNNRNYMAEQYRVLGARSVDKGNLADGLNLIAKSLFTWPSMQAIRTLFYAFRKV